MRFAPTLAALFDIFGRVFTKGINLKIAGSRRSLELMDRGKPVIFTIWHHDIIFTLLHYRNSGYYPVISLSEDGELLVPILRRFGYGFIRGSSTRGGFGALKRAKDILQKGDSVVLTPDGPVGPKYSFKRGAVYLSKITGCPVLPLSVSLEKKIEAGSWDRMEIPLPYSLAVIYLGSPQKMGNNSEKKFRARLREKLLSAEVHSDAILEKRVAEFR